MTKTARVEEEVMTPFERFTKALTSSLSGAAQADLRTRPRRRDFSEVAAEEYRRALQALLLERGECRPRLIG